MAEKLNDAGEQRNPCVFSYFDKLAFRTARPLAEKQMIILRKNASSVDLRRGHHIRGSKNALILTVVNPNDRALRLLANRSSLVANYVEVARDTILVDERRPLQLREIHDRTFVQPRHCKRQTVLLEHGSYTGQNRPGHRFVWYGDRPSKRGGVGNCFHLEGRHHGVIAVRRMGIHRASDLLEFNHAAYWRRHLNFYEVDCARLGRWHLNRVTGQRRQRAMEKNNNFAKYDIDRRTGQMLFRIFGHHEFQEVLSVQMFIDRYGRGPFLRRIDDPSSIVIYNEDTSSRNSMYALANLNSLDNGRPS